MSLSKEVDNLEVGQECDLQMAMKLQEEEDRLAAQAVSAESPKAQTSPNQEQAKKNKS